jgi:hypothetical protein
MSAHKFKVGDYIAIRSSSIFTSALLRVCELKTPGEIVDIVVEFAFPTFPKGKFSRNSKWYRVATDVEIARLIAERMRR